MKSFQEDLQQELEKLIKDHFICLEMSARIIADYLVKCFYIGQTLVKDIKQLENEELGR